MDRVTIQQLFSPDQFRTCGRELVDLLALYLEGNLEGRGPVLDWCEPQQAALGWAADLPRTAVLDAQSLMARLQEEVLANSLHVHHPRNLGHQVAPPLPIAALCDLVAALTNQAMAVYETGPSATLLERQVLRWLCELIGWSDAAGVLTSGGAQANLTALLAARQAMSGRDVWQHGVATGMRILASEHAHYSISRAAGIMGLGTEAVIAVATDDQGRMSLASLKATWNASVARGEQPFVVVASAGCTPTGSVDPLRDIGAFCREQGLWFHVDGAHGASALLSAECKASLLGIEQADSVVWDGHKLLYMPATVSAVLFQNPVHSYAAFAQEASYLFQGSRAEDELYNTSYRTLECTKRMMGLKLWVAFMLYGTDTLGALVTHVFATAGLLAAKLAAADDYELLMAPQTNIVCFRHLPPVAMDREAMNRYQAGLRSQLVKSGAFHLTQASIHGDIWLRATLMNPLTQDADLDALLQRLRELGAGSH